MTTPLPAPRRKRILIVEKHPEMRQAIMDLVNTQKDLEVCGTTDTLAGAVTSTSSLGPDMVVLGSQISDEPLSEAITQIRGERTKLPVIILPLFDERQYGSHLLDVGATTYVSKDEMGTHLTFVMRSILNRQPTVMISKN